MSNNSLEKIRDKKRMSLEDLAKKIGVTRQLLWGFEKGKHNLSTNVMKNLSSALNCKISQILGEDSIDEIDDSLTSDNSTAKASKPELVVVSNNEYPIKDQYLGYAMEILDEMIDHNFHTREEKTHMLSEVYKIVYDFYENNGDKADFAKEIENKIIANQGVLKFVNQIAFDKKSAKKIPEETKKELKSKN
jgi:transcriptional regulator with XRE-family HTH domain